VFTSHAGKLLNLTECTRRALMRKRSHLRTAAFPTFISQSGARLRAALAVVVSVLVILVTRSAVESIGMTVCRRSMYCLLATGFDKISKCPNALFDPSSRDADSGAVRWPLAPARRW
jgi:hypothetical protein